MRLSLTHRTVYRYDPPAIGAAMRLKLFPAHFDGQKPVSWRVTANGAPVEPSFHDPWGDAVATLFLRVETASVEIIAEGEVETEDRAGLLKGLRAAMRPGVCLRETSLTRADEAICALAAEAEEAGETRLSQAHALREIVSARIVYAPDETDQHVSAAEALGRGVGVCQDHAHVMVAAARALGWPARYVAGYCLPHEDGADGAATHAWAEIHLEGLGWIGFDAANGICPTDAYIRLCSGLDAADAAPLRGHIAGASDEAMEAEVAIAPIAAQSQRQQ